MAAAAVRLAVASLAVASPVAAWLAVAEFHCPREPRWPVVETLLAERQAIRSTLWARDGIGGAEQSAFAVSELAVI